MTDSTFQKWAVNTLPRPSNAEDSASRPAIDERGA
ncbi:hypothetical protein HD596_007560 [Nonomuraea jabiensis]|uniref:Uncharacterized protein n=1 Tax=Nonomuraea jabiensis TaxID=882448 RepID=A0A7W9GBN1_9ACTN|nr:hypothetical protein [Nonomuraea jabiensis]